MANDPTSTATTSPVRHSGFPNTHSSARGRREKETTYAHRSAPPHRHQSRRAGSRRRRRGARVYGKIFSFTLRGRGQGQAFIDLGDQFLALMQTDAPHRDRARHFGLVVDDRAQIRALAQAAGAKMVEGPFVDFLDPWGNRIEIVAYTDIQFSKAPNVLRGMQFAGDKSADAKQQLAKKNMAP